MKKRPSTGAPAQAGGAGWLTTFNDLVTLLMVFFVLLFSMSTIDTGKMKGFQESLQSGLGVLESGEAASVGVFDNNRLPALARFVPGAADPSPADKKAEAAADPVRQAAGLLEAMDGLSVTREASALRIRMEGGLLFALGSAKIDPRGRGLLERVAATIGPLTRPIRVEGHTDNVPIHTPAFPSNWELSTARAVNVVKFMIDSGMISPQRLSAVGYGDAKPLGDNQMPDGRLLNRRVEIVLELEKGLEYV
ncbi:MAG: flagellar motor protein MotB [Desulfobacterales bacterium]|nr:flagellar motor protein MotB [Desulfobacterales bacterium]